MICPACGYSLPLELDVDDGLGVDCQHDRALFPNKRRDSMSIEHTASYRAAERLACRMKAKQRAFERAESEGTDAVSLDALWTIDDQAALEDFERLAQQYQPQTPALLEV